MLDVVLAKGVAMPIIRAMCQSCGDVELVPNDLKVLVCSNTGESSYTFHCPGCDHIVRKETDKKVVEILVSAGVKMTFWRLPAELNENHVGPPIEVDDIINFHFEVSSPTFLERLRSYATKKPDMS